MGHGVLLLWVVSILDSGTVYKILYVLTYAFIS